MSATAAGCGYSVGMKLWKGVVMNEHRKSKQLWEHNDFITSMRIWVKEIVSHAELREMEDYYDC